MKKTNGTSIDMRSLLELYDRHHYSWKAMLDALQKRQEQLAQLSGTKKTAAEGCVKKIRLIVDNAPSSLGFLSLTVDEVRALDDLGPYANAKKDAEEFFGPDGNRNKFKEASTDFYEIWAPEDLARRRSGLTIH